MAEMMVRIVCKGSSGNQDSSWEVLLVAEHLAERWFGLHRLTHGTVGVKPLAEGVNMADMLV